MRDISDELLYALNLPLPPAFSLCQDAKSTYKVPDFYGYECPSTRWIIAMLTNKTSLKRLIKCGKNYDNVFTRYYQIPDRPIEVMGSDYPLETPAYHQQSVLYLTPLALAIYMKQVSAVEMLLELKNESGHKIIHPAEACFVQRVFKKGEKKMTNELYNTFPIIIAIRRSFFQGIALLVENGFTPQKQFSVIYRKPFRESVSLFRDVLDYIVDLLRCKPGLNVTKMMKIILDPSIGLTTYDIFVYDIELDDQQNWDYVSIFRRICRIGFGTKYFVEESATQVLNVLEQIQAMGYFGGIDHLKIYYNGTFPGSLEAHLPKDVIKELQSDRISAIMGKIPTIIKASREDLFKLNENELKERINYDYQSCIGLLFLWYQRCLVQERCSHYAKLGFLLTKIMMDTKLVEEYFEKKDQELASVFSEWSVNLIKPSSIGNFRIRMQDYILFQDHLCVSFINSYGESPVSLLNAPMLRGKRPENSPIIRDLLSAYNSIVLAPSVNENINNQSNSHQNNVVLNVFDARTNHLIKFVPANYTRNIAFENHPKANIGIHSRHLSLNNSSQNIEKGINSGNSVDNVINDLKINLQNYPKNCENKGNIKSSNKELNSSPQVHFTFQPNISKEFHKKYRSGKSNQRSTKNQKDDNNTSINYDGKLKKRLQKLLTSNEKYRDFKFPENTSKVPLKFLRPEIQKYKSVNEIINLILKKEETRFECLYNNLNALSMIEIMQKLSYHSIETNAKSSNNEFSQVFPSK